MLPSPASREPKFEATPRRSRVARRFGALAAAALFAGTVAAAADDPAALAKRLTALRAEVEELSASLVSEREALRAEQRSAESRSAELESQVRQEEIRASEKERSLARARAEIAADTAAWDAVSPTVFRAVEQLERSVREGIPFRQEERLASLAAIRDAVASRSLDPRLGVQRLWQTFEDELRLARENALDRQAIDVGGERLFVQVARLGTVAMYFQTDEGRTGAARREASGWTWVWRDGEEEAETIRELFKAFDKQQRSGPVALPWALPEVSR